MAARSDRPAWTISRPWDSHNGATAAPWPRTSSDLVLAGGDLAARGSRALLAHLRQQLAPVAAAAPAAGVGGNVERPWWETPAGTKRSYSHQLGPSVEAWAPGRALPVLVAQGAQPGPTLLVSAGIHGNEYDGMVALRRVWEELDPSELSGTFVAIMCCNVDAHLVPDRNSAYDGQNLARVFPGKVDGTLTERVAYCIQHDFIEKC